MQSGRIQSWVHELSPSFSFADPEGGQSLIGRRQSLHLVGGRYREVPKGAKVVWSLPAVPASESSGTGWRTRGRNLTGTPRCLAGGKVLY
jgi:hypothetical protein